MIDWLILSTPRDGATARGGKTLYTYLLDGKEFRGCRSLLGPRSHAIGQQARPEALEHGTPIARQAVGTRRGQLTHPPSCPPSAPSAHEHTPVQQAVGGVQGRTHDHSGEPSRDKKRPEPTGQTTSPQLLALTVLRASLSQPHGDDRTRIPKPGGQPRAGPRRPPAGPTNPSLFPQDQLVRSPKKARQTSQRRGTDGCPTPPISFLLRQ